MDGVLLINKERGKGSSKVVYQLRKILQTKDIGHCGTLDPEAEGLLVIVIGKALKISRFLLDKSKEYIASCKLGIETSTLDEEGEIILEKEVPSLSKEDVEKCLKSFKGKIEQIPPKYSAISINGKRLYEYARENKEIEIPSRLVEIEEIDLLDYKDNIITFKVKCSKGTYIRTLCKDIANKLNTVGYMSSLKRTKSGDFSLENSFTLEEVEKKKFSLISIEEALNSLFYVKIATEEELKEIKVGHYINKKTEGKTLYLDSDRNPLGMYEYDKEKNITKCIRLF